MRSTLLIYSITILNFIASCQNKQNIVVAGQITDDSTGRPIPNAEVVAVCWYMSGLDDASTNSQRIETDESGKYAIHFDKGYQVDVASKARNYIVKRQYNKLTSNRIQVDLKLSKATENPTLIRYLNTDHAGDKLTFLRIRIHSPGIHDSLDLKNIETIGFDFINSKLSSDTANCDIWFQPGHVLEQPNIIRTNREGGVVPVYPNEINSSFFYDKFIAPTQGYVTNYKLKGNEEGFFVLCRDGKTYGKIIFEKSVADSSGPDGKGGIIGNTENILVAYTNQMGQII